MGHNKDQQIKNKRATYLKGENKNIISMLKTRKNKIKTLFPQIKIVARGEKIKLIGSREQIIYFEKKLVAFRSGKDRISNNLW